MIFQVMNKNAIEKQLSQEKSQVVRNNFKSFFDLFFSVTSQSYLLQLELSVDNSNKAVERMSQNVEELQWRIRNNFDLPVQV